MRSQIPPRRPVDIPPVGADSFFAFFTPFFAPMAFSFPRIPILIGGYLAIAIAHFLYETIHAVHHHV